MVGSANAYPSVMLLPMQVMRICAEAFGVRNDEEERRRIRKASSDNGFCMEVVDTIPPLPQRYVARVVMVYFII